MWQTSLRLTVTPILLPHDCLTSFSSMPTADLSAQLSVGVGLRARPPPYLVANSY